MRAESAAEQLRLLRAYFAREEAACSHAGKAGPLAA